MALSQSLGWADQHTELLPGFSVFFCTVEQLWKDSHFFFRSFDEEGGNSWNHVISSYEGESSAIYVNC